MTNSTGRTRAELLETIKAAKAELEAMNKWKPGDRVAAVGTVKGYIDDEGNLDVVIDGCSTTHSFNEDCLTKPSEGEASQERESITKLADRCSAILGDGWTNADPLATIEAVVKLVEHSNPLRANGNGHGPRRIDPGAKRNGSSPSRPEANETIYAVVRRENGQLNTRFDISGREFFQGYLTKSDCEVYKQECEERESSWGVRREVYKTKSFTISPSNDTDTQEEVHTTGTVALEK